MIVLLEETPDTMADYQIKKRFLQGSAEDQATVLTSQPHWTSMRVMDEAKLGYLYESFKIAEELGGQLTLNKSPMATAAGNRDG